ncbi:MULTISPECIES: NAD-dependent epimerase/dehydratase family protein [unclassified Janthinobacterium]|uniref:NAD-dependent epimerase/dehydratase family protein n=1 Tax=unclassified Janthinobacterium TaxID=2610881 RepID=UPI000345ADF2|nr:MULTISPECIES: NAD-dependent epimerase/dehydratase family protein [unclassified Janthinobacterium]MEC5159795.1 nucleoside-diphosphate-sugar epimerase [Janthinobacterium sp. CG_S6]
MTHLAVTGASGFVGARLLERLRADGRAVSAPRRGMGSDGVPAWALPAGVEVLVHTAARVHVMQDKAADPLLAFRQANVEGTLRLARQAAAAGARRFVFVSSVKVNGEASGARPFGHADLPAPADAYGVSKHEAEQGLLALSRETGLEVVMVRPPLVYGPGVRANFLKMMQFVKMGLPLPLGAVRNRRSLVALDNLVDLLVSCSDHAAAAGQTFMVSDGHDVSVAELLRMLAAAMGKRSRLLPVPPALLGAAAALLGKSAAAERLLGSLQVDLAHTSQTLGWRPPLDMQTGIRQCVAHFLTHN